MAGLGVVAQVLAIYTVIGHLALAGIHQSAMQAASRTDQTAQAKAQAIWSAIVTTSLWGLMISLLLYFSASWIGQILKSPDVGNAMRLAAPAIFLYAINKSAAAVLTGLGTMQRFALQTGLHALMLMTSGWIVIGWTQDPIAIALILILTEAALALFLLVQMFLLLGRPRRPALSPRMISRHLMFGLRGFWSGLAYELNIRIDVIMIGLFLTDAAVGLYALAAQVATGFMKLLMLVRNQLVSVLGALIKPLQVTEIRRLVSRVGIKLVPAATVVAVALVTVYLFVLAKLLPGQGYGASGYLLGILLMGAVFNSALLPFESVLILSEHPGLHSFLMGGVLLTNVVANLFLLPMFDVLGAAMATAIATSCMTLLLLVLVKRGLGFWLLPLSSKEINQ